MSDDITNLPHLDTATGPGTYRHRDRTIQVVPSVEGGYVCKNDRGDVYAVEHIESARHVEDSMRWIAEINAKNRELAAARRLLCRAAKQIADGRWYIGDGGKLYDTPDAAVDAAIKEEVENG